MPSEGNEAGDGRQKRELAPESRFPPRALESFVIAAFVRRTARRPLLIGALAALALGSSLGGAPSPAAQAATPAKTVPYVEPPAPTPPSNPAPRPTGRLVPSQGSLFG